MSYKIKGACDYKKGAFREKNEDNYYFNGEYASEACNDLDKILTFDSSDLCCVFAIYDGVGGEAKGEKASYIGAKVLSKYLNKNNNIDFYEYVDLANSKILENKIAKNMATTLCMISFDKDKVRVCNLGDSRAYLLRDKTLRLISVDHNDKELNDKLKTNVEGKPKITQYLGIDESELTLEPAISEFDYKIGDKYLLCSDGLSDFVINKEIEDLMKQNKSPKELVRLLMEKATDNKTRDNATIEVFEVKSKFNYLFLGSLVILVVLLGFFFYFNKFEIDDQCDSLVVGNECIFKFDDSKYDIVINDKSIVKYSNGKLLAKDSGKVNISIKHNKRVVYEKEVKVFPNN